MLALDRKCAYVTSFIRKLRGGSQPILVEASDGFRYVLKFTNNPQGPNVSFNEAMGTELYRCAGLSVPKWEAIEVTEEFLNRNPRCWIETAKGMLKPHPGVTFGTRYLGRTGSRLWEILPRSSFSRISNKKDFYLAWLLDICARHTDNRQAVFEEKPDGIQAIFIDHGHMFSGPHGEVTRPHYCTSAFLDTRVYEGRQNEGQIDVARIVLNIDVDELWMRTEQLPNEWLTDRAVRNFSDCLRIISDTKAVQMIAELIAGFPLEKDRRELYELERKREFSDWVLRTGIQGA